MHQIRAASVFQGPQLPINAFRVANGNGNRHSHEFLELVLVVDGRARHEHYPPQSDTANCYEIRANDLFFVPMEWSHAYSQTEELIIYNILFQPSLLKESLAWVAAAPRPFQLLAGAEATDADELTRKIHLRSGERQLLEAGLREISREMTLRRTGFELVARARMIEALVLVARIVSARADGNAAMTVLEAGSPVAVAAAFMEEHFSETITLDDIASAAHLNPNYLCDVFKSTFGTSVGTYLSQLRLEHARYLLSTTKNPITEIAMQAGFSDAGYFARIFKSSVGQTPREFRIKATVVKDGLNT